ncbi:Hypothetical_protein [Hexamita inflata]|uniref:Hypothetical_protein n=1 Tax=Hexamita inflata TaxID=28002 RepID=A0AA86Q454_9EUKA|nr:Hypothetical protein HINF_LOCUS33578 [Hexamita inflata]CAI9945935.1 Hypothetical protein HINF_LOCUS33580 [Hexamita inflata]
MQQFQHESWQINCLPMFEYANFEHYAEHSPPSEQGAPLGQLPTHYFKLLVTFIMQQVIFELNSLFYLFTYIQAIFSISHFNYDESGIVINHQAKLKQHFRYEILITTNIERNLS